MQEISQQPDQTGGSIKGFIWETVKFAFWVAIIVIPFRVFVAEPYIVFGQSMLPNFDTGHYLVINKFSHKFSPLERGQIVVFSPPTSASKFYIKRIIGLPGETVRLTNGQLAIKAVDADDFVEVEETYITNTSTHSLETTLGEGEYFVMGDNRSNSLDSRYFGALPVENIRGVPFVRLFPLSDINWAPAYVDIVLADE